MSVYKKLSEARVAFLESPVKKSGKNKFAGYEYFELGDFIPTILKIFDGHGLCGVVHFDKEMGYLDIVDTETGEKASFTTPMVFASNPKGQAIQDLGSTHTYIRRYLWLMAMEIVENDAVDAAEPSEPSLKTQSKTLIKTQINRKYFCVFSHNIFCLVLPCDSKLKITVNY